LLRLCAGRAE